MSVFLERTKREFLTQNFSIDKPPRPLPQQLKNNQRVVTIENNKKMAYLSCERRTQLQRIYI